MLLRAPIGKESGYQGVGAFVIALKTSSDSLGGAVDRKARRGVAFGNEFQGKMREGKHSKGSEYQEHRVTMEVKVSAELRVCVKRQCL